MRYFHNADCMLHLPNYEDNYFDLAIVDPPYFLPAKHYQTRKSFARNFSDLGILEYFFRGFFEQIERVLKQTGSFYIFCDGQSYPLFYYYSYFFTKNVRPIIWDKMVSINGFGWRHQHELILWGEMPEALKIPTGDGDIIKERAVKVDDRSHPAEKPKELIHKLIEKGCPENGIVLDPFVGSGTTLIACEDMGFDYVGYEIDKDYYRDATKRLDNYRKQLKLAI